jgi:hypothetical protein
MLAVGQDDGRVATPAAGCVFSGWQHANFFSAFNPPLPLPVSRVRPLPRELYQPA